MLILSILAATGWGLIICYLCYRAGYLSGRRMRKNYWIQRVGPNVVDLHEYRQNQSTGG